MWLHEYAHYVLTVYICDVHLSEYRLLLHVGVGFHCISHCCCCFCCCCCNVSFFYCVQNIKYSSPIVWPPAPFSQSECIIESLDCWYLYFCCFALWLFVLYLGSNELCVVQLSMHSPFDSQFILHHNLKWK